MGIEILRLSVTKLGSQQAVASRLGISRQRLNNWLKKGRVPFGWDRIITDSKKDLTRVAK
jgi:transcriptional regulator with XRE-family HTH domain